MISVATAIIGCTLALIGICFGKARQPLFNGRDVLLVLNGIICILNTPQHKVYPLSCIGHALGLYAYTFANDTITQRFRDLCVVAFNTLQILLQPEHLTIITITTTRLTRSQQVFVAYTRLTFHIKPLTLIVIFAVFLFHSITDRQAQHTLAVLIHCQDIKQPARVAVTLRTLLCLYLRCL